MTPREELEAAKAAALAEVAADYGAKIAVLDEIEELARKCVDSWYNEGVRCHRSLAVASIRATIARLGPVRGWPSEDWCEGEAVDIANETNQPYEAALEMARRLKEYGND